MGAKTKIDWADSTWNPVTGCLNGCEYCYARRQATRFDGHFGGSGKNHDLSVRAQDFWKNEESGEMEYGRIEPYPYGFEPTFHRYRLDIPRRWKKPRNIFVCSMADLFGEWVPDKWIEEVFKACEAAPQHRYMFLTKNPRRYMHLIDNGIIPEDQPNIWLGSTTTVPEMEFFWNDDVNTFVSIEPILEPFSDMIFDGKNIAGYTNWIIIGAETGNRKNKIVPKKEWIDEIVSAAKDAGTPVFMKESLRAIMGDDFIQEFPWVGKAE